MAVRCGDRSQGKLPVINRMRELIAYTYDRVHDKTLPKSDRWLMCKSIWDAAAGAHAAILAANGIRVENQTDAEERLLLEKKAIGQLDTLMALIDMLHIKGRISDDRAEYWTGLANSAQIAAKAWLKNQKSYYREYLRAKEGG